MSNKDFQNGLIVGLAKGGSSSQEYVDSFGLKTLTLGNLEKAYIQVDLYNERNLNAWKEVGFTGNNKKRNDILPCGEFR